MGCAACEVPEHSLRLRTDDRRTDPRLRLRMAAPLTSSPVAAPLARAHPGVGTFVAGTGRGDLRARSIMRTDAQSCAELESLARGNLNTAGREFSSATALRTGARTKYPARYPPAYGNRPSRARAPRPDLRHEISGTCADSPGESGNTSPATFVAGTRRGDFPNRSNAHTHAQSRAELESSRARAP